MKTATRKNDKSTLFGFVMNNIYSHINEITFIVFNLGSNYRQNTQEKP